MADSGVTFTSGEVSAYYTARAPRLKQRRVAGWRGACPIRRGKDDNFAAEPATERWFCHSTCGRGWDILELDAALIGGDFPTRKAEVLRLVGRTAAGYRHNGTRANGLVVDAYYNSPADIKEVGYMGNSAMAKFSVPQEAVDYALKRSPFA